MYNNQDLKVIKKIAVLLKTSENNLLKLDNFKKFSTWDKVI